MDTIFKKPEQAKILIITKDFSGLGWAKMSLDAGYDTILAFENDDIDSEDQESFNIIGDQMVEVMELPELFEQRKKIQK